MTSNYLLTCSLNVISHTSQTAYRFSCPQAICKSFNTNTEKALSVPARSIARSFSQESNPVNIKHLYNICWTKVEDVRPLCKSYTNVLCLLGSALSQRHTFYTIVSNTDYIQLYNTYNRNISWTPIMSTTFSCSKHISSVQCWTNVGDVEPTLYKS